MTSVSKVQPSETAKSCTRSRVIWIALEPAEILELKRVVLDRDPVGAVNLFHGAIVPRVRMAAQEQGIDVAGVPDDRLPR